MAIVGDPAQAFAAVSRGQRPRAVGERYVTIARSDEPDFVARLYAAGALWCSMPSRPAGAALVSVFLSPYARYDAYFR